MVRGEVPLPINPLFRISLTIAASAIVVGCSAKLDRGDAAKSIVTSPILALLPKV